MASVTQAAQQAFSFTCRLLFDKATAALWFTLGFVSWLSTLGEGGLPSGPNFNFDPSIFTQSGSSGSASGQPFHMDNEAFKEPLHWLEIYGPFVIGGIVLLVLLIGLAISLVLMWINSRGRFMFMDNIVRGEAAVSRPWQEYGGLAWQLFMYRVVLFGVQIVYWVIAGGIGLALAWSDLQTQIFGVGALCAIVAGCLFLIVWILVFFSLYTLMDDFQVPVMYARRVSPVEALGVVWRQIVVGHAWDISLFYLLKLAFGVVGAIVMLVGTCCTCCIAGLPYLSSVVFLPVAVFMRAYSLFYMQAMSDAWRFIMPPEFAATLPAGPLPVPPGTPSI